MPDTQGIALGYEHVGLAGSHFVNAAYKSETVLNAINDFIKVNQ